MLKTSFIITSENCDKFKFTETTGEYSANNESGWNTPNLELSQVEDSYVKIHNITTDKKYEKVEITPSFNDTTVIIHNDLILEGGNSIIDIPTIVDGVYHFEYFILFDTNEIVTSNFYFLSLCELECKLKKLTIKYIKTDCADCHKNEIRLIFLEAMSLYKALIFSYQCADFCSFNKIYKNLIKLLKNFKCKNC